MVTWGGYQLTVHRTGMQLGAAKVSNFRLWFQKCFSIYITLLTTREEASIKFKHMHMFLHLVQSMNGFFFFTSPYINRWYVLSRAILFVVCFANIHFLFFLSCRKYFSLKSYISFLYDILNVFRVTYLFQRTFKMPLKLSQPFLFLLSILSKIDFLFYYYFLLLLQCCKLSVHAVTEYSLSETYMAFQWAVSSSKLFLYGIFSSYAVYHFNTFRPCYVIYY